MRNGRRQLRVLVLLGLVATTGVLFGSGSGAACANFAINPVQTSVNFCFLFDCVNGAYSGLVQFCNSVDPEQNIFVDCAQVAVDGQ